MGRTQRRMPCKGHFKRWRKDSYARSGAVRGENKGGLRKIELQRQGLHLCVAQPLTGFKYTERITAENGFGEHIDESVRISAHELLR